VSELDHALIAGWPLALTVAAFLVRERVRGGRRRGALNRALHELRRPLQALALGANDASGDGGSANGDGPGKLELALAALDDLDHELNGGEPPLRMHPVVCRTWVEGALGRWRGRGGALRLAVRVALARGIGDGARGSSPARSGTRQPDRERDRARGAADPGRGERVWGLGADRGG
jgi:hypothetical protein